MLPSAVTHLGRSAVGGRRGQGPSARTAEEDTLEAVIRTEQLTKTYGNDRGILDLDLEVRPGEVFGFLGPNGAGKTTTIRTILNFLRPTSGRATIFGLDSRTHSVEIRAATGNLPGEFALEPRLTGQDLMRYFGRIRGVHDLAYGHELARRLDADLTRPIGRLSRGNKQKIGLVQAMFHRPPLLVLDEPTGGLDPLVQESFLDIMRETAQEGRTVFLSSHVLSEVERVCDRVGIIKEGRLIALETTDTLLKKRLRRMVLRFSGPVDAAAYAAVEGVEEVRTEGDAVVLMLHDGLDAVVKLTARHPLVDMELERPSLEDVFLTYYGGAS